ncbi:hypothetical protein [Marinomonas transparens]|uniref:Uncharacterized protein n=1 Tax=Marinomonas transparens TaxID=2795388 RepID=A0A934N1F9_9GAMM|nr:hypothetical protein [Marinomonas transparens]MBJ7536633.1 hypothetical protein [Marinomonas transparens]
MKENVFDYSNDVLSQKEVNECCQAHISSYFTVGKQLTVERVGSDSEKALMHGFIDACRAWANSEHPKPKDLYTIKPE